LEHPDLEPICRHGIGDREIDGEQCWQIHAHLRLWVPDEAAALALAEELLAPVLDGRRIVARRGSAQRTPGERAVKPRGPEDLEDRVEPVRWQRADVDGKRLRIVWQGEGERVGVDVEEGAEAVTVTVRERFGPRFSRDGEPIII